MPGKTKSFQYPSPDGKILIKEHCGVDIPSPKAPQAVTEVTVKPSPGPRIPFITNKTIEDLGVIKYPVLPILKKTKERFKLFIVNNIRLRHIIFLFPFQTYFEHKD